MATTTVVADGTPTPAYSRSAATGRRNLLDFDVDEPPSYHDAEGAPAYSRQPPRDESRQLDGSALVYSLRHLSRKRQAFVSMGPPLNIAHDSNSSTDMTLGQLNSDAAYPISREFIVDHKTGAGFSKNKPDFVISIVDREQMTDPSPPVRRRSSIFRVTSARDISPEGYSRRGSLAAPGESVGHTQPIASVRFARSGPLPWTPRASVIYEPAFASIGSHAWHNTDQDKTQDMALRRADANGWPYTIGDREYIWCLLASPNRLALVDLESETEKATFIYSEVGTFADKGGEIGRLSVPLQSIPNMTESAAGRSTIQDGFMKHVICSLSVAVMHWRNEGKAIHNAIRSRPPDIVGDRMPLGSATAL